MADERFVVVIDGTGDRSGSVAATPLPKDKAAAGFETVVDTFADDIRRGDMRISVLAESEFQKRGK